MIDTRHPTTPCAARPTVSGVTRATRLAEQLLALARSEPDGREAAGTVNLDSLLHDCVAAYAPLAQGRGVDLGIEASEAASVSGDLEALRVLFNNLIDNATKYTPSGGKVDVCVRNLDGHAVVQIGDSGPGIPAEERDRVFDRFYRVGSGANRVRTDVAGSGLGLAIVKHVAANHNGTIRLWSQPGTGSTFTLSIPAYPDRVGESDERSDQ